MLSGEQSQLPFWGYVDNLTMSISNTSDIIYQCTNVAQSNQAWLTTYFESFNGTANYVLALVMNMAKYAPNLISANNIIQDNLENCDLVGAYFQVGRITRMLLSPTPIATSS